MQAAQGLSSFEKFMLAAFTFQAQQIKHDPQPLLWDAAHRNKSRARQPHRPRRDDRQSVATRYCAASP
jgi:hypothetical protein